MKKTTRRLLCLVLVFALAASLVLAACDKDDSTTYTLTFALGDHAAEDATAPTALSLAKDKTTSLPAGPKGADGWAFDGWSDGTTKYDAGATYTMPGANTTLTAQWKSTTPPAPTTYTLTFALGNHAATGSTPPTSQTLAAGAEYTLPDGPETQIGWEFNGWNDGTTTYDAGASYTMPSANTTLTAQYLGAMKGLVTFESKDETTGCIVFEADGDGTEYSADLAGTSSMTVYYDYENYTGEVVLYKIAEDGTFQVYVEDSETEEYVVSDAFTILLDGTDLKVAIKKTFEYSEFDYETFQKIPKSLEVDIDVTLSLYKLAVSGSKVYGGNYWLNEGVSIYDYWYNYCRGLEASKYKFNGEEVDFESDTAEEDYVMPAQDSTFAFEGLHTITLDFGEHLDGSAQTVYEYVGGATPYDIQYLSSTVYPEEGWEIVGLNDGETTYTFGYSDENSIYNYTMPDHDVKFTVVWAKEQFTVSFSGVEDFVSADWWTEHESNFDDVTDEWGKQITLPTPKVDEARVGWTFVEWSYGENTYSAGSTFTIPQENVEFEAQFKLDGTDVADFATDKFAGWIAFSDDQGNDVLGLLFALDGKVTPYKLGDREVSTDQGSYTVASGKITVTLGSDTLTLTIDGIKLTGTGSITVDSQPLQITDYTTYMYQLTVTKEQLAIKYVVAAGTNPLQAMELDEGKFVNENGTPKCAWEDWTMPYKNVSIEITEPPVGALADYEGVWTSTNTMFVYGADRNAFKIEGNKIIFASADGSFDEGTYTPQDITVSTDGGKVVVTFRIVFSEFTLTFESLTEATLGADTANDTATFTKSAD